MLARPVRVSPCGGWRQVIDCTVAAHRAMRSPYMRVAAALGPIRRVPPAKSEPIFASKLGMLQRHRQPQTTRARGLHCIRHICTVMRVLVFPERACSAGLGGDANPIVAMPAPCKWRLRSFEWIREDSSPPSLLVNLVNLLTSYARRSERAHRKKAGFARLRCWTTIIQLSRGPGRLTRALS